MTRELFLFFYVGPLRSTAFLMVVHPLSEFLVPYMGCCQIDGMLRQAQGQSFCVKTLARTLSASNEDNLFHHVAKIVIICLKSAFTA